MLNNTTVGIKKEHILRDANQGTTYIVDNEEGHAMFIIDGIEEGGELT